MLGGFSPYFFIGQASSQILTVTQREGLLIWCSLADVSIHCREEVRQRSKDLCTPSTVPEREEWPQHSLDSWRTLGGDGTALLTEALWQPLTGFQGPAQVPAAAHDAQWSFLFLWVHMTVRVCTSRSSSSLYILSYYTFPAPLPFDVSLVSPTEF